MKAMMKNLLLVISITVNVFLVYRFVYLDSEDPPGPSQESAVARHPVVQQQPLEITLDSREESPLPQPEDQPLDYVDYLDHLRQRNLSELEIKQILLAKIDSEYTNMEREQTEEYRYWQTPTRNRKEIILQELAWEAEKRDILRELFGDAVIDDPFFEDLFKPLNKKLGFLSSDVQIELHDLMLKSQAENSAMFGRGFIREFRQDRLTANETMLASIQELLSPQEFLEYQLRESRTANMMRRSMDGYDYGEQEFRDIFAIRQSSEVRPGQYGYDVRDPQSREELQSARANTDDRIREYLGEERYRELERVQDPLYRSLQAIGDRYGNSEREMIAAYEITTDSRMQIDEIRRDQSLSSDERRTEIQKLNEQTLEEIQEVVGDEAAESIQRNAAQFRYGRPGRRGPR
tara:strand:- start:5107 stop:6321 length:1215 start_codon:yes stop_codon:yes gene_type:complete